MFFQTKQFVKKVTPAFALDWYHFCLAFAAAVRCGFPSRKIKVIGVTGTNGKSTTIELISAILKEAGYKVASSSSIKFQIGDDIHVNRTGNTMPGRFAVQDFLRRAANAKCDYAILEVTSEGIKQHRHRFIRFAGAAFTNLTPEHIEGHGGFENYRKAKQKLFSAAKGFHVINADDKNASYFLEFTAVKKVCYGFGSGMCPKDSSQPIQVKDIQSSEQGIAFSVDNARFTMGIAGEFNVYNALAAIAVGAAEGISLPICQKALAKVATMPGRMEKVCDRPAVFVDFAFTPNALEQVYCALERMYKTKGGRLICLLGACGGGRDKWKRPVLGKIAASHCDEIILTNEDPYDEDPQAIVAMVKKGAVEANFPPSRIRETMDRRLAIREALMLARPEDAVILTGKGSMAWTFLGGGKKEAWDEKTVALEEFGKIKKSQQ